MKKYTTIDNKFIDDFFSLINAKSDIFEFVIDASKVSKWLEITKGHLKETLVQSYKQDTDYVVYQQQTGQSGRQPEKIFMTVECFKRVCMQSKSSKSEDVRTYFIEVENILQKYSSAIIEYLISRVQQLENNQKPKVQYAKGVIYIFKSALDMADMYKLGKSTDFPARMLSHNQSHPDDLEILFVYETDNIDQVEQCVKNSLKQYQYRKRKEFYKIDFNIIKQIICKCDNFVKETKLINQPNQTIK